MTSDRDAIFLQHLTDYHIKQGEYENQVMLITGAANGIGRELSLHMAKNGATVILLDKDETSLNALYDEIKEKQYAEPIIFHIDLNNLSLENVNALVKQTEEGFSRIDAIIICAAQYGTNAPIEHYQIDDWNKTFRVNLFSNFLIIKGFLPLLRATQKSTVLVSSSKLVRHASAYWGALGVAEKGMQGLVQILAEETENDDINILSLDPGEVYTSFMKVNYPGRELSKLLKPSQVVSAYCYLLSKKRNSARVSGSHYYIKDRNLYGYD